MHLMSGRAGPAAIYPKGLCNAICWGLARQKRWDTWGVAPIASVELTEGEEVKNWNDEFHEEDGVPMGAGVYDGVSGENELV